MNAFLFAGQGAQYIGMGRDLYEAFGESKKIFEEANEVLGFSLSRMCFQGSAEDLVRTQNSQPAILTVSIAALEAYRAEVRSQKSEVSYVAGLSLGEYSALVASGAISFKDAVYLVRKRGEFMEEEALKNPGGMLSIIGLDLAEVEKICRQTHTEVANINCPGQIVISGGTKEIEQARNLAEASGAKKIIPLEVSGAFHSSFMRGASLKLAQELDKIRIDPPKIAVVSNVKARPVNSPVEIRDNLVQQVASSVLWEDSMKFILSQGIMDFIEFGPGKVLKGLMRRINSDALVTTIENKEDIVKLLNC